MRELGRGIRADESLRTKPGMACHVVHAERPDSPPVQLLQRKVVGGRTGTGQEDGTSREEVPHGVRMISGAIQNLERIFPPDEKRLILVVREPLALLATGHGSAPFALDDVTLQEFAMMYGLSDLDLSCEISEIAATHFSLPWLIVLLCFLFLNSANRNRFLASVLVLFLPAQIVR